MFPSLQKSIPLISGVGLTWACLIGWGSQRFAEVRLGQNTIEELDQISESRELLGELSMGLDELESAHRAYVWLGDQEQWEDYQQLEEWMFSVQEALGEWSAQTDLNRSAILDLRELVQDYLAFLEGAIEYQEIEGLTEEESFDLLEESARSRREIESLVLTLWAEQLEDPLDQLTALGEGRGGSDRIWGMLIWASTLMTTWGGWRLLKHQRQMEWELVQTQAALQDQKQHQISAIHQVDHLRQFWQAEVQKRQRIEAQWQTIQQEKAITDLKLNFFSLASHEFSTPLSSILVSTQLLETSGDRSHSEKTRRNLRRIRAAARTMTQLLSDILTLTRAEAGKLEFNPQLLELEAFCRSLVEEVKFNTQAPQQILIDHQGDCSHACLDEKLVRSILMSLLTNAIKYSPEESEIQLVVIGKIGRAIFEVQDQGVGIPAEEQHQLFESFQRGASVGHIPGTGLGLAVVKRCLELHQGQISLDSTPGVGSRFTVEIPWTTARPDPML